MGERFEVLGRPLRVVEDVVGTHAPTVDVGAHPYPYLVQATGNAPGGPQVVLSDPARQRELLLTGNRGVLLFVLARQLARDRESGLGEAEQGWCATDDVLVAVWGRGRKDANHLNVLVHRVRGQLGDEGFDPWFVEKRRGCDPHAGEAGGRALSVERDGVVVATAGRRVVVRDDEGERACFLSGQRAVVGDRVRWVEARGEGGKIASVDERDNALVRADERGREQVLAANLAGVLIVCAPVEPAFRAGLVDRYLVAAGASGLAAAVVLNKVDQGVPPIVEAELALRVATGVELLRTSTVTSEGMEALRERIASTERPWALVGHSGTGKTRSPPRSCRASTWARSASCRSTGARAGTPPPGRGCSRCRPGAGSWTPRGFRTFAPGRIDAEALRDWFPGVGPLGCRYRDCLHREGEDGCVAAAEVPAELLVSYRRLLAEILRLDDRRKPWT